MNILELTLLTHDLRALRAFYLETLELDLVEETADSFAFGAGESRVRFVEAGPDQHPYYHFAFNIVENQVDEAIRWLENRAPLLSGDHGPAVHFESWNAHSIYFHDPAGNVVEFIARHSLHTHSEARFGPGSVLGVSEVGMPVPRVRETVRYLDRRIPTELWDDSGNRFTAVGDEIGLFILVPRSHLWYPTRREAGMFPIALTIAAAREMRFQIPGTPYVITARIR